MNPSTELSSRLMDYLERRISLGELESWVAPRLPVFLDSPDSEAARLAGAIELSCAELGDGLRSERSIRLSLRRYCAQQKVRWVVPSSEPEKSTTESGASTANSVEYSWFQTLPSSSVLQGANE